MCDQHWIVYQCGCQKKGEFVQCDAQYNAQTNLQCDMTNVVNDESRNYCSSHLPKQGKATTKYTQRQPNP